MEARIIMALDPELKEKIEKAAGLLHITVSAYIRMVMRADADRIIDEKGEED